MTHQPVILARAQQLVLARLAAAADTTGPVQGPDLAPCLCKRPRHEHSGATCGGRCAATGCTRYREDVAYGLAAKAVAAMGSGAVRTMQAHDAWQRAQARKHRPGRRPGQWGVSASDVTNCRRAIWYRETPPEDFSRDWEDKREAVIGTAIHEKAQRADEWAHPWREHEKSVTLDGLDANLRYDVYDPLTCEVIDYKSAGQWRWDTLADGPEERAWWQLQLYGLALNRAGKPVHRLRMIYIRRENGHEEFFTRPYDDAVALEALQYLIEIATMLDLGEELPRDRSGPGLDPLCGRCFARSHCWDLPRAEAAGRSPQSWVYLGPAPADRQVERVLDDYDAARADESSARKAKEWSKACLVGVDHGRYGDWMYGETLTWKTDQGAYVRALEEHWSVPEILRPDLDELRPKARQNSSISIKKVRAAKREKEAANRPAQPDVPTSDGTDPTTTTGDAA